MGGVFYARNLLKALNMLDDNDKPIVDVYCRTTESFDDLKSHTNYPYLNVIIINDEAFVKRAFKKLVKILFGYNASCKVNLIKIAPEDVMLFPYGFGSETKKLVYWRPDFQDKYFPSNFSSEDLNYREKAIRYVGSQNIPIIFSSYDCEKDYKKFYPEYSNPTFVVHFAVEHDDFSYLSLDEVREKYGIKQNYLLCANQFWKHKNHLFLFKAYKKALQRGLKLQLVCTGKLYDFRNPDYIDEIKSFVISEGLSKDILFPGLIDTDELHCLMKNSYAIVQPSLFEGWNTTVEDSKALGKFIFLSDLSVHREQVKENVCFFNPHDEEDLVLKLLEVKPVETTVNYSNNLYRFGADFLRVIKYVKERNTHDSF